MLSHLVSHLQHLLQVVGELHVGLAPCHGQEAESHLQSGESFTHLTVGLQLPSDRRQGESLKRLLLGNKHPNVTCMHDKCLNNLYFIITYLFDLSFYIFEDDFIVSLMSVY